MFYKLTGLWGESLSYKEVRLLSACQSCHCLLSACY